MRFANFFTGGVVPGTVRALKALVPDANKDLASLRNLTVSGVLTQGAASLANAIVGVAAGYKVARSAAPVALDGSNPTSVAHGLTTCVSAQVQQVGSVAPGLSTSNLTCVINGANIDVYAWKPTSVTDPTQIASTGTETFNWIAVGT